ncbi:MAG: NAD(P)/FAD-dependent oxidoreductase [Anaerolineae bacterium]|jgi:NADH dehydrogenase|nr:NAD(P)/FAD-dependent oxidoreductase [Anaerolineae bacterium]
MSGVTRRPRVVIIGAGFGGLYAARQLANQPVDVLLIDRNNFHLFTPLLYQVATCALDPSQIAYPIRRIFRKNKNIHFRLGTVIAIDTHGRSITVREDNAEEHIEPFDYLIVATGTETNFFGNTDLQKRGFGMKDLSDAVTLRNHILRLFEKAAWETSETERRALTTIAVVGGGPTGLETAGAIYELYNYVLKAEYAHLQQMEARVILLEAMDHLLDPYPEGLRQAAYDQLKSIGVEVMLNAKVKHLAEDHIELEDGRTIPTHTLVWSAGVKANSVTAMLGVNLERGGRIPIQPTLEVTGLNGIYAVGDIAHLIDPKNNHPYPQVIPVANQQGSLAAKNIMRAIQNQPQEAFQYHDRGIMATIGRRRAVAYPFYKLQLTGWFAWITWLLLHLVWLLGFRNQIVVFINWVWNYLTFDRSVRIILHQKQYLPEAVKKEEVAAR